MSKFIVHASNQVDAPKYLKDSTLHMNIGTEFSFSPLEGPWPSAAELGLDEMQFEAFHAALTKEFAIIQGPPGTGKTFIGKSLNFYCSN